MDKNSELNDRIRFHDLQVFPVHARTNCEWQHPASSSATQSWINAHCSGHAGIGRRSLTALEFIKHRRSVSDAKGVVNLVRNRDLRRPDWMHHLLWCSVAARSVLAVRRNSNVSAKF